MLSHSSNIQKSSAIPVSCYIRTFNEENRIVETVRAAVKVADEVVVVDSGSTDSTVQLAVEEGARVVEQSWLGYGHQKRIGEDACRHDWLLDLDADEVISEELAEEIRALFSGNGPTADIYELSLATLDPTGRVWRTLAPHTKLYNRQKIRIPAHGAWDHFRIPSGLVVRRLKGVLFHYSFDNMGQLALKTAKANILQVPFMKPRKRLYSSLKVYCGLPVYFFVRYVIRGWYREGSYGFMTAVAVSYAHWCRHAMLHESYLRKSKKIKYQSGTKSPMPGSTSLRKKDMRSQFADHIKVPETREAYHRLLELVDNSKLKCEYRWNGKPGGKRSCNFYDDARNIPYAFIVNQSWLRFYFRKYTLTRIDRKKLEANLTRDFGNDFDDRPNQRREYHVELRRVADVEKLAKHLDW